MCVCVHFLGARGPRSNPINRLHRVGGWSVAGVFWKGGDFGSIFFSMDSPGKGGGRKEGEGRGFRRIGVGVGVLAEATCW